MFGFQFAQKVKMMLWIRIRLLEGIPTQDATHWIKRKIQSKEIFPAHLNYPQVFISLFASFFLFFQWPTFAPLIGIFIITIIVIIVCNRSDNGLVHHITFFYLHTFILVVIGLSRSCPTEDSRHIVGQSLQLQPTHLHAYSLLLT